MNLGFLIFSEKNQLILSEVSSLNILRQQCAENEDEQNAEEDLVEMFLPFLVVNDAMNEVGRSAITEVSGHKGTSLFLKSWLNFKVIFVGKRVRHRLCRQLARTFVNEMIPFAFGNMSSLVTFSASQKLFLANLFRVWKKVANNWGPTLFRAREPFVLLSDKAEELIEADWNKHSARKEKDSKDGTTYSVLLFNNHILSVTLRKEKSLWAHFDSSPTNWILSLAPSALPADTAIPVFVADSDSGGRIRVLVLRKRNFSRPFSALEVTSASDLDSLLDAHTSLALLRTLSPKIVDSPAVAKWVTDSLGKVKQMFPQFRVPESVWESGTKWRGGRCISKGVCNRLTSDLNLLLLSRINQLRRAEREWEPPKRCSAAVCSTWLRSIREDQNGTAGSFTFGPDSMLQQILEPLSAAGDEGESDYEWIFVDGWKNLILRSISAKDEAVEAVLGELLRRGKWSPYHLLDHVLSLARYSTRANDSNRMGLHVWIEMQRGAAVPIPASCIEEIVLPALNKRDGGVFNVKEWARKLSLQTDSSEENPRVRIQMLLTFR